MSSFTHLLVTRFNLALWDNITVDEAWLEHRFALFEHYCYPSVKAQTTQDFTWAVLFAETTPQRFRDRIDALTDWPNFVPVYLEKFYSKRTIEALAAHIKPGSTHLISTTLDNDDALSAEFIATAQAQFNEQFLTVINFPNGLRLAKATKKLYHCAIPCNPFVTLIEELGEQPHTVARCLPHSTIPDRYPDVREIETDPLWLQVVHGRNADATGVRGLQRASAQLMQGFGISAENALIPDNKSAMRLENARAKVERAAINATPTAVKTKIRNAIWTAKHGRSTQ